MLTISQLARHFGLSRSTLLYYDSIGLLTPSERSSANYRLYSDADVERMEQIDLYRKAGLPLADIARVVSATPAALPGRLEARLRVIDGEVRELRRQQRMIVRLLQSDSTLESGLPLDKQRWIEILRATGLGDEEMQRWHVEFERQSPKGHQQFLESLAIDEAEIDRIRAWSRGG